MYLESLKVSGYRSIRRLTLEMCRLNVVVGANGTGKSNLYRALELLQAAAAGRLTAALASEGAMMSALWAGKRRKGPVRMVLNVRLEEFEYELQLGLPVPGSSAFFLDPEVKEEKLWFLVDGRKSVLMQRDREYAWAFNDEGQRVEFREPLIPGEAFLSQLQDPARFSMLYSLREHFLHWRFYHGFRTDPSSPVRQPQPGFRTPVLSSGGDDLAAALQTIIETGDEAGLQRAVQEAFPDHQLIIDYPAGSAPERVDRVGMYVLLKMPEFQRAFDARELSDGTLRYLCLIAALLSPRPPVLLVLNEPETSLHPSLIEPLANLILSASRNSQVWLTTHSETLAEHLKESAHVIHLSKADGETQASPNFVRDHGDE